MHQALRLEHHLNYLLFPTKPFRGQHEPGLRQFTPLDSRILDNAPQRNAISGILGLPKMSPPYIVFGP